MNKKTLNLLLLLAAGAGAVYFLTRRQAGAAPQSGTRPQSGTSSTDAAVLIAQAQAQAAIAQADAAKAQAEAAQGEWYSPLLAGIGQSLPQFASAIGGAFGM